MPKTGWYLLKIENRLQPVFVFRITADMVCCATFTYKPPIQIPVCTYFRVPLTQVIGLDLEEREQEMDELLKKHNLGDL